MHGWLQIGELFARVSMGAILNSLWQGLLLALVAWFCLRLVPRSSASLRYGIWCIALIAVLALPLIAVQFAGPGLGAHAATGDPVVAVPQRFAQTLFIIWYVSASALVIRLILSYVRLQQLKASAVPLPPLYQSRVRRWLAASGGQRECRLCVSDRVPMPVAIGLVDPVIILPERLIEQLSEDEFDQIGLHEVAHLQRWDDYTNVFQKIVEALLFFNPAVYLIGRQLTLEREIACDDRVIAATGKPLTYALCLTRLVEATALARQPLHALGALSTRRQFAIRIERLLDRRGSVPAASRFAATAACIGIAASLVVAARLGSLIGIAPNDASQATLATPAHAIRQLARIIVTPHRHVAHATVTAQAHPARVRHTPVLRIAEERRVFAVARPNAVGARNFSTGLIDIVANAGSVRWVAAKPHKVKSVHYIWYAPGANASMQVPASAATIEVDEANVQVEAANEAVKGENTQLAEAAAAIAEANAEIEALNAMAVSRATIANQVAQIAQLDVRISREVPRAKHVRMYVVVPRVATTSATDLAPSIATVVTSGSIEENVTTVGADALTEGAVAVRSTEPLAPPAAPAPPAPPTAATQARAAQGLAVAFASVDSVTDKIKLVEKLAEFADFKAARDALISALEDDSLVVKLVAIRALAHHLDGAAERAALIAALRNSDSAAVQLRIIAAFACEVGEEQVRKVLAETMLRDDAPARVQAAAAQALAPVASDPEVHAALEQAGGSDSDIVRAAVKHTLSQHPNN